MKHKQHIVMAVGAVVAALVWAASVPAQAAGSAIYLSPSNRSLAKGATIAVAVRVNAASSVNAVQANLTYPADKLDYVSISYGGSAFGVQAQSAGGGGTVQIGRGSFDGVSGDKLVATVTFRAKVDSGNATVSVSADSSLANDGAVVAASKSGASYTLTAAPVTTPPPPTPTPAPKDTSGPSVSDIKVTAKTAHSFTVAWKTSEPATGSVEYGLDASYGLASAGPTVPALTGEAQVNSAFVQPLWTYHFRIKATDGAGNSTVTPDQTVTTEGLPVTVVVKDAEGHAVAGATVTLGEQTMVTNQAGEATLMAGSGTNVAQVSYQGRSASQTLVTKAGQEQTATQTIVLAASRQPAPLSSQLGLVGLASLAGVAVLIYALVANVPALGGLARRLRDRFGKRPPSPPTELKI